jgi:hypothetical protein
MGSESCQNREVQENGFSQNSADASEQKQIKQAERKKVLAQYPVNQWIVNGWASGIQEPTNKKVKLES